MYRKKKPFLKKYFYNRFFFSPLRYSFDDDDDDDRKITILIVIICMKMMNKNMHTFILQYFCFYFFKFNRFNVTFLLTTYVTYKHYIE